MNKKIYIFILLIILIIALVIIIVNTKRKSNNEVKNQARTFEVENEVKTNKIQTNNIPEESEKVMAKTIKVIIDNKIYTATLEENETTKQFLNMLPKECKMNELNGNEKYCYLDNTLPTKEYSPKQIEAGDIMLFGNNCLVVFYKSFTTSYSYTKIGHIDNLPDLGNGNIYIKFNK